MAKSSPKAASRGSSKDASRRAVVEQMRREQQAKERRKTFTLIGAAVLIGALIIGTAVWQLLKEQDNTDTRDLASIGVPAADAGCRPIKTKSAEGSGDHRPAGEKIIYPDTPPAFGPHWGNFLTPTEVRKFYIAKDRPEVERLVHSLEHGWTILWYDDTIAGDSAALDDLRAIAGKFPDVEAVDEKIIIAPWTAADGGKPFPGNTHLAFTHWSLGGTNGNPQGPRGVWEYCGKVSGEAVADFMADYPATDSPEGTVAF